MLTFEFQAQVENGTIIVPDEHQAELAAVDRVTRSEERRVGKEC